MTEQFCTGCEKQLESDNDFGSICADCFKKLKRPDQPKPVEIVITPKTAVLIGVGHALVGALGALLGGFGPATYRWQSIDEDWKPEPKWEKLPEEATETCTSYNIKTGDCGKKATWAYRSTCGCGKHEMNMFHCAEHQTQHLREQLKDERRRRRKRRRRRRSL